MVKECFVRRSVVLATSALAVFALVSFYDTGTAVAADRMVLAENFTATW